MKVICINGEWGELPVSITSRPGIGDQCTVITMRKFNKEETGFELREFGPYPSGLAEVHVAWLSTHFIEAPKIEIHEDSHFIKQILKR